MKALLRLSLLMVIVGSGLLLAGYLVLELSSMHHLMQVVQTHRWLLLLWRYGLYAVCILLWPYFIKFVGLRQKWPPETIAYFSQQRLKLLGFFIIIEVFFVYNLVGHLIAWL